MTRLLLLLFACAAVWLGGCNTMPPEEPGYQIRFDQTSISQQVFTTDEPDEHG